MKKFNFSYSLKNIPTLDEKSFKLRLLEEIEVFLKKMLWRAIFLYKQQQKSYCRWQTVRYSLKRCRSPPRAKYLIQFEGDLVKLVKQLVSQDKG